MEISRDQFAYQVVDIVQEIAASHFVAFDLELSGVAGRSIRSTPGKPTLQEYYEEVKEAAEKYQILQVGLTVVQEDVEEGGYIVKPYNFDISQVPTLHERHFKRTWSMNSGAISFLLKNGFDFGKQIRHGVQYLSRLEEEQARKSLLQVDNIKRPDMLLKPEDDALIDHIRLSLKRWLETPDEIRENFLNIPSDERAKHVPGTLNRYQIRLTHQVVQKEFPGLKTQGMNHFVQITNPSTESLAEAKKLEEKNVSREVARAVGFRWLLEAMATGDVENLPIDFVRPALSATSNPATLEEQVEDFAKDLSLKLKNRRKIFVGHNCFTDLVNLHKFMLGWLPQKVEDFAESMNKTFPAIVDTKYIANFGNARWGDTSLAKVEEDLRVDGLPNIVIAPTFDRYRYAEIEHEAGYDSLLTANIAIRASAKMESEGVYRKEQHIVPLITEGRESGFGLHPGEKPPKDETIHNPAVLAALAQKDQTMVVDPIMDKAKAASSSPELSAELVVVKDNRPNSKNVKNLAEVATVKSLFAKTTIYDVFKEDRTPSRMPGEDTGNVVQSNSGTPPNIEVDAAAKAVDFMPRWDSDFWSVFGNRLQVNGCKEGVCRLK